MRLRRGSVIARVPHEIATATKACARIYQNILLRQEPAVFCLSNRESEHKIQLGARQLFVFPRWTFIFVREQYCDELRIIRRAVLRIESNTAILNDRNAEFGPIVACFAPSSGERNEEGTATSCLTLMKRTWMNF